MRVPHFADSRSTPITKGPDIRLLYFDTSYETGFVFYELSGRVSTEDWMKIKDQFHFYREPDEDTIMGRGLYGWLTTEPATVEKLLGIKEENTLAARREAAKKREAEREEKSKAFNGLLTEIMEAFQHAEYPDPKIEQPEEAAKYTEGFEKMAVDGLTVENPKYPTNIYGGGEWFVIQPDWIWFVRNNGADGDDWMRNNINTWGAGAIGVRVPYSNELAEKIKSLPSAFKSLIEK